MGIISRTTLVTGDILTSTQWNTQFDTIYNEFNGNIENANIDSGADIAYSKMATTGTIASAVTKTGITTGAAVGAGFVGEQLESTVAVGSAVSLTTNTYTDITSKSITAGSWLFLYNISFTGTPTGSTAFLGFVGTVSGNNSTGRNDAKNSVGAPGPAPTAALDTHFHGHQFVNISSTATYYLKALATFSGSTCSAYGTLTAVRIA